MPRKRTSMLKRTMMLAILALSVLASCGSMPIKGRVVDSVTGKPIEGAVVVAEWTYEKTALLIMHASTETYKVIEKLTDADGNFQIEGVTKLFSSLDVSLSIYKRGYVCWNSKSIYTPGETKEIWVGSHKMKVNGGPREDFVWKTGQTYQLQPWQEGWSHEEHEFFFHSVIRTEAGDKNMIRDAIRWEELEASKEGLKKEQQKQHERNVK